MRQTPSRTAYTLVELLVVIAIILLIATLATASLLNDSGESQIREASRMVASFLQKAQALAIKEGKPVGVMIERFYDETTGQYLPSAAQKLHLVYHAEDRIMPDFRESRAFVNSQGKLKGLGLALGSDPDAPSSAKVYWDSNWRGRVSPGDFLVLDRGRLVFQILDSSPTVEDTDTEKLYIDPDQPPALNTNANWDLGLVPGGGDFPTRQTAYTYYIERANPFVPRSSSDSIELPDGVCIDMDGSGLGINFPSFQGRFFEGAGADFTPADLAGGATEWYSFAPVLILFGPDGTVNSVHGTAGANIYDYVKAEFVLNATQRQVAGFSPDQQLSEAERKRSSAAATSAAFSESNPATTFLLIGKFEQAGVNTADLETRRNWQDQSCLWVSVRGLTGEVRTSPVSQLPNNPNNLPWYQQISFSRQYALQEQGLMGGAGK